MEYVDKQVKVAKEMYEVFQAVGMIVDAAKAALKDGWQPGTDIPMVLMAAMPALGTAIQGMDKIPVEMKEDLSSFLMAGAVGGSEIAGKLMK